ncbi:MAG: DUF4157 domain-containing protein [Phaeodactylibacter sp.]|nr:DUF4157 domain-containing protein [Phaeodactylibacter sp.]
MEYEPISHKALTESHQPAQENETASTGLSLAPPTLQLKSSSTPIQRENPEEEEMQLKKAPIQREGLEEDELQLKKSPFQLKKDNPVQRSTGGGTQLPGDVMGQMESSMGTDFSDVRIHTNSPSATDAGALAYTQGNDIHFGPGQFNPGSSGGQELIGHELAHVVQQREGRVKATGAVNGMPLNDDHGLEAEADQIGRQAAQKKKS